MRQELRDFFADILATPIVSFRSVGGGDINEAWQLETRTDQFFVKLNQHNQGYSLLETEVKGLDLLRQYSFIRVPEFMHLGQLGTTSYLLLEFIPSGGPQTEIFWRRFGELLAQLHQQAQTGFGLSFDNFIGTLPQSNAQHLSGISFLIEERFLPQMKMAIDQKLLGPQDQQLLDQLCRQLPDLIPDEPPALIHGDLWSGNFMTSQELNPVLIDPAVGCTYREFDIAMSKLFGGFSAGFYEAYQATYPLQAGWKNRLDIYQLYYLLAHVNLFGGSYVASVRNILQRYS